MAPGGGNAYTYHVLVGEPGPGQGEVSAFPSPEELPLPALLLFEGSLDHRLLFLQTKATSVASNEAKSRIFKPFRNLL